MERRHYAAILLLVFGIIEVYSFSPRTDSTDSTVSRDVSEDKEDESEAQVVTSDHEGVGRIRREKPGSHEDRNKKQARLAELAVRAAEEDRRQRATQRQVAEHRLAEERYEYLIDGYVRRGYERGAAMGIIDTLYPELAAQMGRPATRH